VFPDESCSIDMAKEYFIPDMEGYDYEDHIADYTTLYIVLAVVWSLLAVGWYGSGYNINGSMVSSLPLSQSLSPLPAVKAAACMLGCGLWSRYASPCLYSHYNIRTSGTYHRTILTRTIHHTNKSKQNETKQNTNAVVGIGTCVRCGCIRLL